MAEKPIDLGLNKALNALFTTQEERDDADREKVVFLPLIELHPFKNHPFRVEVDDELRRLADSIAEHGVLSPALARPRPEGGYELLSGHRRMKACSILGLDQMPVIVREMDDDQAIIVMVDSNQQRENLLPSEKAFAYQMKLEALKHQGRRTSRQVGEKLTSIGQLSETAEDSERSIQRYIRLTYLLPELLKMVDEGCIAMTPAVELSYLPKKMQEELLDTCEMLDCTPRSPRPWS